jgi:cytochrome c-type biogenesis protein
MGGPHQALEQLWDEHAEVPEQPFTYIEFHLNSGKGGDELTTPEGEARAAHYMPGIAYTPDAEFDGGYIKLSGSDEITYPNAKSAIEDCTTRYEREFNPLHPLQSLRTSFKFVELFVDQTFTGDGFAVSVTIHYLGSTAIVGREQLRGTLYVFMVEDNVEAYSKALETTVLNRNVFRGYAIENHEFTLGLDETYTIITDWDLPQGLAIPIKPADITAIAAVYDLDDTSSEEGNQGNRAQVPRCIQTATPRSTAFDRNNDLPVVADISLRYRDGKLKLDVKLEDSDGIAEDGAYALYNLEAPNSTRWSYVKMNISGEELCDESGVCYAYTDSTATAIIPLSPRATIYLLILAYDGSGIEYGSMLGAQGKSEIYNYTAIEVKLRKPSPGISPLSIETISWILGIALVIFIGAVIVISGKRRKEHRVVEPKVDVRHPSKKGKGYSKRLLAIIFSIVIAIVVITSIWLYSTMTGTTHAPDFTLTDIDGNTFSLSDFRNKVVLLDFMTTTCDTCIDEMPELKHVAKKYGDKLVIITISVSPYDTDESLREFKTAYGGDWIYALGTPELTEKYGAQLVPKIVIVNKNGDITYSHVGKVSRDKLSAEIEKAQVGGMPVPVGTTLGLAGAAVVVGVGIFFSPCSFPLLPGYMAYYLRMKDAQRPQKALFAGTAAALGLAFFLIIIGIIVGIGGYAIMPYVAIIEPFIGIIILALGIIMLTDYMIPYYRITQPIKRYSARAIKSITGALPLQRAKHKIQHLTGSKVTFKSVREQGYFGLFIYGIGYGCAGAGCMAPLMLGLIVAGLVAGGLLNAFFIFLICAIVTAVLMIFVTLLTATSAGSLIQKLRLSTKWIKRICAIVLIIVGIYLIAYYYYGSIYI